MIQHFVPRLVCKAMSSIVDLADKRFAAGVTRGVTRPFVTNTEWSGPNTTQTDALWKALPANVGMVAIDKQMSEDMSLYATESFPWDHSKGVYLLEGYHSLHCLVCPHTQGASPTLTALKDVHLQSASRVRARSATDNSYAPSYPLSGCIANKCHLLGG